MICACAIGTTALPSVAAAVKDHSGGYYMTPKPSTASANAEHILSIDGTYGAKG